MAAIVEAQKADLVGGGAFLLTPVGSARIQCPEGFSEEQRMYYRTASQFSREQVAPKAEAIEHKAPGLLRDLLRKAGELGLLMIDVPERFGGMDLDKTTSMLVAEVMTHLGAWSVTFGAHVGIGTLPIVFFGNEQQKQKYLPKLVTGELVAAYALTETGSGSDALGAKTKAVLTPDGKHYVLNGSKQFITNASFADVFVVFAKVDGDKFTGFIVDRSTPGFSIGSEEHKMGIRGSSTCALVFEDAKVPAENVLGEIGKGHRIAFNILNVGRLKLGVASVGGCKHMIEASVAYAKDRKQFGKALVEYPLIREKIARMAAITYAGESMSFRTSGLIDAKLATSDKAGPGHVKDVIEAVEEYAIEASILKVFGSEAMSMCADEAVQIHGGYGYTEEFSVERAYRDARINRIFEGTNEINRMLISGMLLKRAMKGQLALLDYAAAVEQELSGGEVPKAGPGPLGAEQKAAEHIKRLAVYALKVAVEKLGPEIEQHQELLAAISDVVTEAFAVDSAVARTLQVAGSSSPDPVRVALVRLYTMRAHERAFGRAREALCAASEGAALQAHLANAAKLYEFTPYNPEELRETIVSAVVERGGYPFAMA